MPFGTWRFQCEESAPEGKVFVQYVALSLLMMLKKRLEDQKFPCDRLGRTECHPLVSYRRNSRLLQLIPALLAEKPDSIGLPANFEIYVGVATTFVSDKGGVRKSVSRVYDLQSKDVVLFPTSPIDI